jgi:hypothetical protein
MPQLEAETYYTRARLLHPIYYPKYWMGLQATTASWPNYRWTDGFTPGPDGFAGAYINWGVGSSGAKQPDNNTHLCGTADYLLARNFTGNLTTLWGWNDVSCTSSHASICWQPPGEQAGQPPAGAAGQWGTAWCYWCFTHGGSACRS